MSGAGPHRKRVNRVAQVARQPSLSTLLLLLLQAVGGVVVAVFAAGSLGRRMLGAAGMRVKSWRADLPGDASTPGPESLRAARGETV